MAVGLNRLEGGSHLLFRAHIKVLEIWRKRWGKIDKIHAPVVLRYFGILYMVLESLGISCQVTEGVG